MSATYYDNKNIALFIREDEIKIMSSAAVVTFSPAECRALANALHKCADAHDPTPQPDLCRHGVLRVLNCYECNRHD